MGPSTPEEYRFMYFFTNAKCRLKWYYPDITESQIMDDGFGALFPMDVRIAGFWIDVSGAILQLSITFVDSVGDHRELP